MWVYENSPVVNRSPTGAEPFEWMGVREVRHNTTAPDSRKHHESTLMFKIELVSRKTREVTRVQRYQKRRTFLKWLSQYQKNWQVYDVIGYHRVDDRWEIF